MTLKELFLKLFEKDSYEILIWLQFLVKKIDCRECILTRKQASGKKPDCSQCIPASSLINKHFGKKETPK